MSAATVLAAADLNQTFIPVIRPELKHFLVQVHATAFLIAWLFVVVSMSSARYLRQLMPNYRPFGLLVWFHLHRTLNIIALGLMLVGLLSVFYAYEFTWKGPTIHGTKNWSPGALHTLFGVLATVLSFSQPFNAWFRCSPTHPKRKLFSFGHRSVGIFAWVFGAISLGIACRFFEKRLISTVWAFTFYLLELFVVISFVAALEYWSNQSKKQKKISENGKSPNRRSSAVPQLHCAAVSTLSLIIAILTTSICALVWLKGR